MFSSSSHAELLALLRAIVEAKFHKDPGDLDVPGSAVLAQVALRVRDAVIAFEVQREGAAAEARWQHWVRLDPTRPEWEGARSYAAAEWVRVWARWSAEERYRAAVALLSPFELEEAAMNQFLTEVGSVLPQQPTGPGSS
jgi:hypothetical protein